MPILTDNDLIDLLHNNVYKYDESGKTSYYNGLLKNFDGFDIKEYLKIAKSQNSFVAITEDEITSLFQLVKKKLIYYGKIKRICFNDVLTYPMTITDTVIDNDTNKTLTVRLHELEATFQSCMAFN